MQKEKDVSHLRSPEVARQVASQIENNRLHFASAHGWVLRKYIIITLAVYVATMIAIPIGLVPLSLLMDVVVMGSFGFLAVYFGGIWLEKLMFKK